VLALDFDGVVCDALGECAAVTWYAANAGANVPPGPAAAVRRVPAAFLATFASARAYSRTLADFMVANAVRSGVTLDRVTFERWRAEVGPGRLAAQARRGETIRAEWRRTYPKEWIGLHKVQAQVASLVRAVDEPLAIVSAKDAESIREILAAAGLDQCVSRIVGSCQDKPAVLAELVADAQRQSGARRVLFIDDNLENALAAARMPGIESHWAHWGYHGPEDDRAAAKAGMPPLLLDQVGDLGHATALGANHS